MISCLTEQHPFNPSVLSSYLPVLQAQTTELQTKQAAEEETSECLRRELQVLKEHLVCLPVLLLRWCCLSLLFNRNDIAAKPEKWLNGWVVPDLSLPPSLSLSLSFSRTLFSARAL